MSTRQPSETINAGNLTKLTNEPPTPTLPALPLSTQLPSLPIFEKTDLQPKCAMGIGLRAETVPLLLKYQDSHGMVMTGSARLSEDIFPLLEGWIRILGAPSLEDMEKKAERALLDGIIYEALAYGLETNESTPAEEWHDLVGSTQKARALVSQYNKLLVMGPGFRLMSENEEKYPPMASLADIWMLQTQQLQKGPPGPDYRKEVIRIVEQIRSSNPDISVWAQITFPPDREPDAQEWLAYHQSIMDVVDGTYIGVYIWETTDHNMLLNTIEQIYSTVCEGTL